MKRKFNRNQKRIAPLDIQQNCRGELTGGDWPGGNSQGGGEYAGGILQWGILRIL